MIKDPCIHVAYADDHALVRTSILSYIQNLGGICADIEANNGLELIKQLEYAAKLPDVVMLDINMPGMDGFETLQYLKQKWPHIKSLILTAFEAEWHLIKMINIGANGYLLKNCNPRAIKQALETIHEFGFYYADAAEEHFYNKVQDGKIKLPHISEKEMEYLKYCPTDMSYSQIAVQMNTTVKAIEGCMARLCEKLHIKGRIGLAMFAIQFGYSKIDTKAISKIAIGLKK
ncbi:MAG: response regulator transcription factor [Bacteroidetes bacterium]|nr:response regulator transcription factor [Bacteroidota bacterium]